MSLTIKRLCCLAAILIFVLCSCGETSTGEDTATFPTPPDKITVGADGVERVILPSDEEYSLIVSKMEELIKDVDSLDYLLSVDRDPDTGEHISVELRKTEVFVEYVYDEVTVQKIKMMEAGGGTSFEDKEIGKIFFPLTREHHGSILISSDTEYKNTATLGSIADDTSLIKAVREMTSD